MVSNIPSNFGYNMNYGYMNNSALNDDFMYNAYLNQTIGAQQASQPSSQPGFQGNPQQPAAPQGSGIPIGNLLLKGGTVAAAAGAGYYFANPLLDASNFKDSFIKTVTKKPNNAAKVNQYVKYFDPKTKTFTKEAPQLFNKAVKNFKWKQAGKWGAIAAGTLLATNWLFGRKQNPQEVKYKETVA